MEQPSPYQLAVDRYIKFIQDAVSSYQKTNDIIRDHQVMPDRINSAQANFFVVNTALIAETERLKLELQHKKRQYEKWYDEAFINARNAVIAVYESKKIKPSVTEYETQLRVDNAEEYQAWTLELDLLEANVSFFERMLKAHDRQYDMLRTISTNMRSEMKSLGTDQDMDFAASGTMKRTSTRALV